MDHNNRSNTSPPEKGGMTWSSDNKNTQQVAPYDPSRWATPPPQGDRAGEGTLILVDENGNQVGGLGEHINVAGVVPGSQEPVEIDLSRTDGVVTLNVRPSGECRDRPQSRRSHSTPESRCLQPLSDHKQNALGRSSKSPVYLYSVYVCPQKVISCSYPLSISANTHPFTYKIPDPFSIQRERFIWLLDHYCRNSRKHPLFVFVSN
ncbi:hypothetical protein L211DRAFT_517593 [Terfezia boudieri ATCC MYA-4762]|uniref:Uncharacterized protein n=1 Tax=Terfezia boudieri ATCC MYA-4762 TaxID=1051890 RepID=A0A3N4LGF5_9PEZI|nr:hypothetical protein L211DRAFT_517593 [Terfezia boudieri ATCC MYA-4762]